VTFNREYSLYLNTHGLNRIRHFELDEPFNMAYSRTAKIQKDI